MKIELDITLTPMQEVLLLEIELEDCYEQTDFDEDIDDDLQVLVNKGLIDTILGEQFYITDIGRKYIEKIKND